MRLTSGLRNTFIAGLIATTATAFFVSPAAAVNFNFTFDNTYYVPSNGFASGVAGIVTGEIFGLSATGTSAATAISITSVPTGSGLFTGFYDLTNAGNIFTVTGGALTSAYLIGGLSLLGFNWNSTSGGFAYLQTTSGCNASDTSGRCKVDAVTVPGFGTLAFAPADVTATPLPGALPLFATGLAAVGFAARRRRQKALA